MVPNPRRRDRANQKVGVEELQQQHGHQTTHGKNSSQRERERARFCSVEEEEEETGGARAVTRVTQTRL
jgi:hypothetical protein